jgi:hypothetical protein
MNASSLNIIDNTTSSNPSADRRSDANRAAAVGLWQKAIGDKADAAPASTCGSTMPPQKSASGPAGAAPDTLQQSQLLSRFGRAAGMNDSVSGQAGVLGQVGAETGGEQSDVEDGLAGGATPQNTAADDAGDAARLAPERSRMNDDEMDSGDGAAFDQMTTLESTADASAFGQSEIASALSPTASVRNPLGAEASDAQHLTKLVERFADRLLMDLDSGNTIKQMQVELNPLLLPGASLVLQRAGSNWTLRAQTRANDVGEKLKLAESGLKQRFRARGLGEIDLEIHSDERTDVNAELA